MSERPAGLPEGMKYYEVTPGEPFEVDVSSCVFEVHDADHEILLQTFNYKEAFAFRDANPGSTVHVSATVDVTVEELANIATLQQLNDWKNGEPNKTGNRKQRRRNKKNGN